MLFHRRQAETVAIPYRTATLHHSVLAKNGPKVGRLRENEQLTGARLREEPLYSSMRMHARATVRVSHIAPCMPRTLLFFQPFVEIG